MRKTFFFAVMALFAATMMAQEEVNYPEYIDGGYDYKLDGITRGSVNTDMLKRIMELETEDIQDTRLNIVVIHWRKNDAGNYFNDTIARFMYENKKPVQIDDNRLETDKYKDVIWSVYWSVYATTATETEKTIKFNYSTDKYIYYNQEADTSYTAYAGRPYRMLEVGNPLYLPVTFSSSDEKVGKVDAKSGEITVVGKGETMIKASFEGTSEIAPKSAQWKLFVKEGDHYVLEIITPYQVEKPWGTSGTYWAFDRIKVTEANCNDIYGDGKLSFDIKTRTLKMNNYKRTYTDEEDSSMGWTAWLNYESGPLPLNIQIIGNCEILHNSAGFFGSYDIRIFGDGKDKSRLTLLGRFPQLSVDNKLIIDGVQVHAVATTPHPLMHCKTLRVEDNSHFDAFVDIEAGEGEDPRKWGASVGEVAEVEFGDNTIMLSKEVHIEDGVFIDGEGRIALRVEIGPKIEDVIAADVTFEALELTDDPTGTMQDGILYTLTEKDEVDKTEGCLVINSAMTAEQMSDILDDLMPGSTAFADKYNGLTVLLPVGKGNIEIDLQTTGNYQLAVQIGKEDPKLFTQATKGKVQVPFDNKIATFAYIYAVAPASALPTRRSLNEETPSGSVKLYALNLTSDAQGVEEMSNDKCQMSNGKFLRNGQLYIMYDGRMYDVRGAEVK